MGRLPPQTNPLDSSASLPKTCAVSAACPRARRGAGSRSRADEQAAPSSSHFAARSALERERVGEGGEGVGIGA